MQAIPVTPETIVKEVASKKADGWRFVTMSCVDLDENSCDLLYHFDKNIEMAHLRMTVPKDAPVPSISGVFFAAFLIENETQDHFGLSFEGLVLDYDRTLYLEEEVKTLPFCKYTVREKQ